VELEKILLQLFGLRFQVTGSSEENNMKNVIFFQKAGFLTIKKVTMKSNGKRRKEN